MSLDFTAVDFETIQSSGPNACSVGAAKVRDGKIIDTFSSYIRTPIPMGSWNKIAWGKHKTPPELIMQADCWQFVFPKLESFAGNDLLAFHNARSADISILNRNCNFFQTPHRGFNYICTQEMFKTLHPNEKNGLGQACKFLGVDFSNSRKHANEAHHNAEYDAIKCAELLIAMISPSRSLEEFDRTRKITNLIHNANTSQFIKEMLVSHTDADPDQWLAELKSDPTKAIGKPCIICGNRISAKARQATRDMQCCTAKCAKQLQTEMERTYSYINSNSNFVHYEPPLSNPYPQDADVNMMQHALFKQLQEEETRLQERRQ